MIRAILIAIVFAVVGSLEVTAQPVTNQQFDNLSREVTTRDSINKLELERLDSLIQYQKDRLDTLKLLKTQREELLDHAESMFSRSLGAQNTYTTWVGILIALLALVFSLAGIRLFKTQKQIREDRKEAIEQTCEDVKRNLKPQVEAVLVEMRENAQRAVDEERKKVSPSSIFEKATPEQIQLFRAHNELLKDLEEKGGTPRAEDHVMRAWLLSNKKLFDAALREAELAIFESENYDLAHFLRGFCLQSLERYEEAIAAYHELAKQGHENYITLTNKGVCLSALRRHDEAIDAYEAASRLKPDDSNIDYNRACTYALMKKKPEMLEWLTKAINLDSKNKDKAQTDPDFAYYRDEVQDEDFLRLVGLDKKDND